MLSEEKVAPYFVRQTISWSSNESSAKKYYDQTIIFTPSAVELTTEAEKGQFRNILQIQKNI